MTTNVEACPVAEGFLFKIRAGGPGTHPGWPQRDTLGGLLAALQRWDLSLELDQSSSPTLAEHPARKPFRSPMLGFGKAYFDVLKQCMCVPYGSPIYPEHPNAVAFQGNFVEASFGFCLETDDPALIARLDEAIGKNIAQLVRRAHAESEIVRRVVDDVIARGKENCIMQVRDSVRDAVYESASRLNITLIDAQAEVACSLVLEEESPQEEQDDGPSRLPIVWESEWQTSDDGLKETKYFVAQTEEGFCPGAFVSHLGSDPGTPGYGAPFPTLELAKAAAYGSGDEDEDFDCHEAVPSPNA